jgi:protoporphyrinogen oxidase
MSRMSKVAIVGAGTMGLATAYHALKAGHAVDVFEADRIAGGMAAHFDFGGVSLERYYHFVCKADKPTFELLKELDLLHLLRWRPTFMGYFFEGVHYDWGNPLALLTFPHLGLVSKLRYGLFAFLATKRKTWADLDRVPADDWIKAWCGERGWQVLWEKLFTLKFFEFSHDVSAAWIWTRIKRVGTSRTSLMQEELGYIEGGSETLVRRLVDRIVELGGGVHLGTPVDEVLLQDGRVTGITAGGVPLAFDQVITTVPLPQIPRMIPDLPEGMRQQYAALKNVGVVCVVHKLRRSVTRNFWININDERMDVPGMVEFSNLRNFGADHIIYFPYYLPVNHPKFSRPDEEFIKETYGYLKWLNPALVDGDRLASRVSRLRYAQPVCPPRYLESIPPVATPIRGLQIADTSSYYPEDRGVSEGVRLAREMAARLE